VKNVWPRHASRGAARARASGQLVIRRRYVLAFFQKLPRCLVGIEACASSHHWSRELQALGHTVRLMPQAYVRPYVKRPKSLRASAIRPLTERVRCEGPIE
jgi:transposase